MSNIVTKKIPVTVATVVFYDKKEAKILEEPFFEVGKIQQKKIEKMGKEVQKNSTDIVFIEVKEHTTDYRECSMTYAEFFIHSCESELMGTEMQPAITDNGTEE